MDIGAATHPGYVRAGNEDAFFVSDLYAVFAVADGMGGHEFGEVASRLALETVAERAGALAQAGPTELPALLHETVQAANAAILSQAQSHDAGSRMGTTLVLATICGDRLYFAHIGDSRLYLLRGAVFTQLTRDHSLVQAMVDRGEITPDEAAIHPLRHQITRVVGGDEFVSPEIASQSLEAGDRILLCTDGLSGMVAQVEMKELLTGEGTAQQQADALVKAALDAGGADNVTVVTLAYARPRPLPPSAEDRARKPRAWWRTVVAAMLTLLVAAAITGAWMLSHPRHYITTDHAGMLILVRRWSPVSQRPDERITDPNLIPISFVEVQPYLAQYGDPRAGIRVAGKDAGVFLLKNLASSASSQLLEEAKAAVDAGNLVAARQKHTRAVQLRADPEMLSQVDNLITRAEEAAPVPAPE